MTKKQTIEERFKDKFRYSMDRPMEGSTELNHNNARDFINQELTSLAQEILEKKRMSQIHRSAVEVVSVSDILAILTERGIELEK